MHPEMQAGFIGLGNMGLPMARNLRKAGHELTVFNRTRAKADELAKEGARVADRVSAACGGEAVVTMLADDHAVESAVFAPDGILKSLRPGALHLSMGTISPALSARLAEAHHQAGLNFKTRNLCLASLALLVAGMSEGCSRTSAKSPDVSASVRTSLNQAGFKDVSVSQDRDKGVVTLAGHVATDGDKSQAESVARSIAETQVVSNQIAVIPPGGQSDAIKMNSDLDKGIDSNLDAALINEKLHEGVRYAINNHVVTLTGEVDSQAKRGRVEQVASAVPNVQQVVNELQVKEQKASSSN
jgi:osmotically-inducible protein OsmY